MIFFCQHCPSSGLVLLGRYNTAACPSCLRLYEIKIELTEVGRANAADFGKRELTSGDRDTSEVPESAEEPSS